jgi:uncharacterized protein
MEFKRQFELDIYKLSLKKHIYEFNIDDQFFTLFEESFINKGQLQVKVELDRSETMIMANFVISGYIELMCDRSLDEFNHIVDIKENIIFKYGEEYQEISEVIVIIPKETQKLDISQYIYEFIGLSIPMKKLHPRFCEDTIQEDDDTETKLIFTTGSVEEEETEEKFEKPSADIWEKLKSLKNNNN